ncbi:hypothetical protein BDF20DRAFT_836210 [Mycotypha africana]|uniref:uncharacterized protein n=1 Tax=Mycotypha africana TaxID=64632 RepID=UPI0023011DC6|nr:uncharacterized protein BDF20DRAFT_836210 [Mycotypha africana]KAI8977401.1 hypothetical protein BDF20DRAFT_836210 [Mycotypha africana]
MIPPHVGSYVTYLRLPTPVILPVQTLAFIYMGVLFFDYFLIKTVPTTTRQTKIILHVFIATYHFILPIFIASKYDFGNISFMVQPWILAAQIIYLANKKQIADIKSNKNSTLVAFKGWITQLVKIATFQDESKANLSKQQIRIRGLKKTVRGLAKFAFMKLLLDPVILPKNLSTILKYPFYSFKALYLTYALGWKIYCMMSVTDIIMGVAQAITLIRFNDVFDNPFMSTSRRWNRPVSRLYHQFIFTQFTRKQLVDVKKSDEFRKLQAIKHQTSIFSLDPTICGFLVFLLSGIIHDFMIAAAARIITFELTLFFLIHGAAVAVEVQTIKMRRKAHNNQYNHSNHRWTVIASRVIRIILTTLFFLITGRLFINPILQQEVFLRVARQF